VPQVVTIGEDSEVFVWQPRNGTQILTYIDLEHESDAAVVSRPVFGLIRGRDV